jgi:hypothetical protein
MSMADSPFDETIKRVLKTLGISDNPDYSHVKFTKNAIRDVAFFSIFPILIGVFLGYAYSGKMIASSIYMYAVLLIVFSFALYSNYSGLIVSSESVVSIMKIVGILLVLFVIITISPKFSKSGVIIFNYLVSIILTIIVIIALGIVYYVFKNELEKLTGLSGIIVNIIFYIPCLITDFIEYLKEELNLTPNIIFILFIIEIIFILLYFYAEKLIDMITIKNKNLLLNEPRYLNEEFIIYSNDSTNHFLTQQSLNNKYVQTSCGTSNKNKFINNYYSISFWVYVNPTNIQRDNLNIFNYSNGKPQLLIKNNKYIIYYTNNAKEGADSTRKVELDLPFQKWNHFVFNYYDNSCDLFVNGIFSNNFTFTDNLPKSDLLNDDKFVLGEMNGLDGSICNVQFYSSNLSGTQISRLYNKSVFKNPPISS